MSNQSSWEPPKALSLDEVLQLDRQVASMPDLSIRVHEDIFRIRELEMDWDIGVMVYEPENTNRIPIDPNGKKIGIFLLHGGVSDFKSVERIARILPGKFAIKVASMTCPGRFYFLNSSRDWPGDVEIGDGSARTPLWTKETQITPDQYEIIHDQSKRKSYGTLVSLSANREPSSSIAWPHGRLPSRQRSSKPLAAIFPRMNSPSIFMATPPAGRLR